MTTYPDASVLVSAFADEPNSATALAFLTSLPEDTLLVSSWTVTEIASALGIKVRTGTLEADQRRPLHLAITTYLTRTAQWLEPIARDFTAAVELMLATDQPLRAGDALHLAISSRLSATAWTFDRRMAQAGQALGLNVRLLA
ncbi:type II toxin-antitoxin system VapC family toxin [Sphingomonas sp.]|uniref:type II toxin-antitoxin system VapC family toxin n=1 Tax=Sphingomonas sp. TaxID=28214 RepID=UPI003CC603D3